MSKIEEAIAILKALGLPKAQQNERSALTLLSLVDLKRDTLWSESKKRSIRIHDILIFIQENYGKQYAENTRETIRRQTLHQFEQAGIVIRKLDWDSTIQEFVKNKGKLIEKYEKRRTKYLIPVDLPGGTLVNFSPGKHNELQVKIIKEFRPRFCPDTKVVYVGDAARKLLYIDENLLKELKIPLTKHDKLPDVLLYDQQNFHEFKRHIDNIAWETEVWIENNPDHMIHFNVPSFLPHIMTEMFILLLKRFFENRG